MEVLPVGLAIRSTFPAATAALMSEINMHFFRIDNVGLIVRVVFQMNAF